MGSLRDALAKSGLVSDQQVRQAEAENWMGLEVQQKALRQKVLGKHVNTLEDLVETHTVREFRDKARKLLTERPDLISEVVRLAHQFKEEEGGKRLVWQVLSTRDQLRKLPPEKRDQFLRRAFRAHAPTTDIKP